MNYIKSSEFADVLSKYCKLDERRQIKYICPTVIGQLAEELEQLSENEGKLHSTSMEGILKILNKYKWGATETYLTEDIITEDDFEKIANDIIKAITQ